MALFCADLLWIWIAIFHGNMNRRILSKPLSISLDWGVLLKWVCGGVILYMRKISDVVMQRACHDVAVIWSGTPKRQTKISLGQW